MLRDKGNVYIKRIIAVLIVMVLSFSTIPVFAASKSTSVKNSSSLNKTLKKSKVKNITFKFGKEETITVPETKGSEGKSLTIAAPKANIVNCTLLKSVTLQQIGTYREEADGNSITVTDKEADLSVSFGKRVEKITSKGKSINLSIEENGIVDSLLCACKNAKVSLKVGVNSKAVVSLSKKTDITVKGRLSSRIKITSNAKGSKVTVNSPVEINAAKNMTVVLEKGSEGTTITKSKKSVNVKIINHTDTDPVVNVEGEIVFQSYNVNKYNYNVSAIVNSYLFIEDGFFWRLEYIGGSNVFLTESDNPNAFVIEKYDSSWNLVKSRTISFDPSLIWGGFYHGSKYNFIILGQENPDKDDNKMVIRVIKYDKNWKELGSVDLNGTNTTIPFHNGSLRCAEKDGYLYIITAHNDYHPYHSNMHIFLDEEKMIITYVGYQESEFKWQPGNASSSNQFIIVDDLDNLVTLDHGNHPFKKSDWFTHPQGVQLSILGIKEGKLISKSWYADSNNSETIFPILNEDINSVNTGASVGGLEETDNGYVVALNYDEFGGQKKSNAIRNIYIEFISKTLTDNFTNISGVRIKTDGSQTTTPVMVSIGKDKGGYIFWTEYKTDSYADNRVCYIKYDVNGTISEINSFEGQLSDCKPIYDNGFIYWYVSGIDKKAGHGYTSIKSAPYLYSLNTNNGEVKKTIACGTEELIPTMSESRNTESCVKANLNYEPYDILLFEKDIFDKSGKLVKTEFYDNENKVFGNMVYNYDKSGKLIGKTFSNPDYKDYDIDFGYYEDGKTLKSISYIEIPFRGYNDSGDMISEEQKDIYAEFYFDGNRKYEKEISTKTDSNIIVTKETDWLENGQISEIRYVSVNSSDKNDSYEEKHFYENGQVVQKWIRMNNKYQKYIENQYFDNGHMTRKDTDYLYGTIKSELYDNEGNIIKTEDKYDEDLFVTEYNKDGSSICEYTNLETNEKMISYYNADGVCLKEIRYFGDGKLMSTKETEIDDVLHQTKITELMYYDNEANSLAAKYVDIYDNDNLVDEIFSESLYYDE